MTKNPAPRSSSPRTMAEVDRRDPATWLLAGGTDLLVRRRAGLHQGPVTDVSRLRDAPEPVRETPGGILRLSALAPLSVLAAELGDRLPALVAAIACFASGQIRNRATLGGNLANASPAADTVPPLVAYGAVVGLRGPAGTHEVPVAEFATGPGRTCLAPGEWIEAVEVPPPPGIDTGSPETAADAGAEDRSGSTGVVARSGFRKVAGRRALAISVVSLAWAWAEGPGGALRDVRLAAGAVAPVVVRCPGAEAVLEGRVPDRDVIAKAVEALDGDISPISDLRASAAYRRRALKGALVEALTRRIS